MSVRLKLVPCVALAELPPTSASSMSSDVDNLARPLQAAVVSAITFSCGAGIPLLGAAFVTDWKVRGAHAGRGAPVCCVHQLQILHAGQLPQIRCPVICRCEPAL